MIRARHLGNEVRVDISDARVPDHEATAVFERCLPRRPIRGRATRALFRIYVPPLRYSHPIEPSSLAGRVRDRLILPPAIVWRLGRRAQQGVGTSPDRSGRQPHRRSGSKRGALR